MIKRLIALLSLLSVTFLTGCFGVTDSTDTDQDSTTVDELTLDAVLNPDSSVQIYLPQLPFMFSWEVEKNGVVMDTLWNQLWLDTSSNTENSSYDITLKNSDGEPIAEKTFTPKKNSDVSEIGLIYPHNKTKLVIGSDQMIFWNPESFPSDSVSVEIKYVEKLKEGNGGSTTKTTLYCPNTGDAKTVLKARYFDYAYKPEESNLFVTFKLSPVGIFNSGVYTYESGLLDLMLPNYSSKVTFPSVKDTVNVGKTSYLTWDKTLCHASNISFSLRDENALPVYSFGEINNNGEYVWTVPNIEEGYYHIKLDYRDKNESLRTMIGFPFYIKK